MEQKNNYHQSKGLGSGFLLGLILGVVITLLFTTKRGREILKNLTEKGLDRVSDFQDDFNKSHPEVKKKIDDVVEKGSEYVNPKLEEIKKEVRYLVREMKEEEKAAEELVEELEEEEELEAAEQGEEAPKPHATHAKVEHHHLEEQPKKKSSIHRFFKKK